MHWDALGRIGIPTRRVSEGRPQASLTRRVGMSAPALQARDRSEEAGVNALDHPERKKDILSGLLVPCDANGVDNFNLTQPKGLRPSQGDAVMRKILFTLAIATLTVVIASPLQAQPKTGGTT